MEKIKVLIQGATGETGGDLVDAFIEDGGFEIFALVRPQSAQKPTTKALQARGVESITADLQKSDVGEIANLLRGIDVIISAVAAEGQMDQLALVDAAVKARVKRFVPCSWITICPPGGIMDLRDQKEIVHQRIWCHKLPYTIVDVGNWHQVAWPGLPSGRFEESKMFPNTTIYGDGSARNLLTDKRDVGRFMALILKDERTLNKRIFLHSDVLNQNQIWETMERKSGEKIQTTYQSAEDTIRIMEEAKKARDADAINLSLMVALVISQYNVSKFVRQDNTPENAKYLGYLDARELYPDFQPITFEEFVDELLAGKGKPIYVNKYK